MLESREPMPESPEPMPEPAEPMPESPGLRVSDQEREHAVREIREHYAAGRLTDTELSDRVQAAYAAQTRGELVALRADLPVLPATLWEQRAELARRRADLRRRVVQQSGGALVTFVICTAIWLVTGAHGMFWPVWIALAGLIVLLRNGWRLYGPAPELDRLERELARPQRGERIRRRRLERGQRDDR
jgi:hypothetical protein